MYSSDYMSKIADSRLKICIYLEHMNSLKTLQFKIKHINTIMLIRKSLKVIYYIAP